MAGFISIGVLVVIQIVCFAYGYGKLSQKVNDSADRINKVEKRQSSMNGDTKDILNRVAWIEGKLRSGGQNEG